MTKVVSEREFVIIDKEFAGQTDHCKIFLVIQHQERAQILLSMDDGQLPCIQVKPFRQFSFEKTVLWIPEVRKRLGLNFDITFLRCIWHKGQDCNEEGYTYDAVLVLDSHGDDTEAPLYAKWEELSRLPVPHPEANDAIQAFITECRTKTRPPLRALYARQGWFRETSRWMELQLAKNGFGDMGEVKQIRSTYRGTVFQANTDRGLVYLKCSPFFVNEALVAEKMARLLPENVGTPIAIDVDKRLLLMRDYGEIIAPIMMDNTESEQWAQELAKIHQATVGKEDILQEAGLKVIPVETLPAKLEDLLNFVEELEVVSADVLEQFKQLWPQIRSDCRVVQEVGVPMTFIHGDIFVDNAYRPTIAGGHYGMIDWAQAAISHPFFDTIGVYPPPYLSSWQSFLSSTKPESGEAITMERLVDCHDLCVRLEPLFSAVRLYLERLQVDSSMPVEMRKELETTMRCLVRNYTEEARIIGGPYRLGEYEYVEVEILVKTNKLGGGGVAETPELDREGEENSE